MDRNLYIATFSEDAVKNAADYGVGVELNHICISDNLNENCLKKTIYEIKRDIELSQTGIKPIIHGPFTELCPGSIDSQVVQLAYDRLNQAFDVADRFGIDNMVVHSGYIPLLYYKPWHLEKSVAFWQKFMSDKPKAFHIYIENVFEDEPFMMRELIEGIDDPRVRICLDVGHANVMTDKTLGVSDWIRELGPHIGHLHLHNNDGKIDLHNGLPDGIIDMRTVMTDIDKNCNKETTVTIESRTNEDSLEWLGYRRRR